MDPISVYAVTNKRESGQCREMVQCELNSTIPFGPHFNFMEDDPTRYRDQESLTNGTTRSTYFVSVSSYGKRSLCSRRKEQVLIEKNPRKKSKQFQLRSWPKYLSKKFQDFIENMYEEPTQVIKNKCDFLKHKENK